MNSLNGSERLTGSVSKLRAHLNDWDPGEQLVAWNIQSWTQRLGHLGEPVRSGLAVLDSEVATSGGIRRSWVHDQRHMDPLSFLVIVMAWGFGRTGYGAERVRQMVESAHEHPTTLPRITDLAKSDAGEAYPGMFGPAGRALIRQMGVAFGTKFLYFSGYRDNQTLKPLIYDRFVHTSLWAIPDRGFDLPRYTGGLRTRQYLSYLEFAQRLASEQGIQSDWVERALFEGLDAQ
ncbi:MAG: hypothetical protein WEE66_11125 [Actinomycetota bacterium]